MADKKQDEAAIAVEATARDAAASASPADNIINLDDIIQAARPIQFQLFGEVVTVTNMAAEVVGAAEDLVADFKDTTNVAAYRKMAEALGSLTDHGADFYLKSGPGTVQAFKHVMQAIEERYRKNGE